jgi:predicted phosphodiesterase
MRIALLSDIHGNSIALDAVLADICAQGDVDAYWFLGDYAALGYDPVGVLEQVARLPNAIFVRGNTEHYVVTGQRPALIVEQVQANPRLLDKFAEVTNSFAWTQGAVTIGGWLDWLEALPIEQRLTLPDGTRWLGVHASPGTCDGLGLRPDMSDEEIQSLVAGCGADLVCVGHTHWPMERQIGSVRIVNLGSVSNPLAPDLRACYVMLEADEHGYRTEHRRVDYDREAAIAAVRQVRYPGVHHVLSYLTGQQRPPWEK